MKLEKLYLEIISENIVPSVNQKNKESQFGMTPLMKQIQQNTILQFTPEKLAKEVINQNIIHPDVVLAQAMLESGHFKSNLFKKNNNVFGMKFPRQRQTTSKGEKYGQAYYSNWIDSVKDYKLWQQSRNLTSLSKDEYIKKLDKIYCIPPSCASNNYSSKVKQLLGRANQLISKSHSA